MLPAALLAIGLATLIPAMPAAEPRPSLLCLNCGDLVGTDIFLNIILFVPLGAGLGLGGGRARRAVLWAAAASVMIELLQLTVIPGRDPSLRDILADVVGARLGFWLAGRMPRWIDPAPQQARRLAAIAAGGWLALQAIAMALLRPAPTGRTFYGHVAPELAGFDRFEGVVHRAAVLDRPMPSGPLPWEALLRAAFRTRVTVTASIQPGPATPRLAPIVMATDQWRTELLLLGMERGDLVFRARRAADGIGLRGFELRLPGRRPGPGPDPVAVRGVITPDGLSLDARDALGERSVAVSLGPSLGWVLIAPWRVQVPGASSIATTVLWVVIGLVPLGYWLRRARVRGGLAAGGGGAVMLIGYLLLPRWCGLPAEQAVVWMGGAAGLGAGWRLGTVGRRSGKIP